MKTSSDRHIIALFLGKHTCWI